MAHALAELAVFLTHVGWADCVLTVAGRERHVGLILGKRGIGDQATRLADLVHHPVAGIDAERAGDAFQLLPVPDVDAHGTDRDASVAIDAIADALPRCGGLFGVP